MTDRETLAATITDGEEKIRLTDSMSKETVMMATHATADTVYGRVQTTQSGGYYREAQEWFRKETSAVPLMGVERIEVRQHDPVKTGAAVGAIPGALIGAGLAGFLTAGASSESSESYEAAIGLMALFGGVAGAAAGGLLGAGIAMTVTRRDELELSEGTVAAPTAATSPRQIRGGVGLQGAYGWFLESSSSVGAAGGRFDFLVHITQLLYVGPELAMYFPGNTTGPSWSVHGITRGQTSWRFPLYVYGGLGWYQWDVPDDPLFGGPNDVEFIGYCLAAGLHSGHRPAAMAGEVRLDSGFGSQRWNTQISASLGVLLRW